MKLHYVLFDGTSAFVVDEQDMLTITADDKDVKVIYKSISIDQAFEMADLYNRAQNPQVFSLWDVSD
jgi:hypothetical protein